MKLILLLTLAAAYSTLFSESIQSSKVMHSDKKFDSIFISKKTCNSVQGFSDTPMKVLSSQLPAFSHDYIVFKH